MNQMFFLFFAFRSTCPGLFRVHVIRLPPPHPPPPTPSSPFSCKDNQSMSTESMNNFTLLKTSYALPPSPFSCQDNQSMSTESMNNFTLLKNLQKSS